MRVHVTDDTSIRGPDDTDVPTRCGRIVPRWATKGDEPTCAVCMRQPRKPTVTSTHPCTKDVADALGAHEPLVRALARLPGCPRVHGGRGYRFVSVEAFRAWHDSMSLEDKLKIKPYAKALKEGVVEQISKVSWGVDASQARALMRKSYGGLQRVLAWWEKVAAEDAARLASART